MSFSDLFRFAKTYLLGALQQYIYGEYQDFLKILRRKGWIQDDGSLHVPADKLDDFAKDCWKAFAHVIRHG